jgi:hypothetical protein
LGSRGTSPGAPSCLYRCILFWCEPPKRRGLLQRPKRRENRSVSETKQTARVSHLSTIQIGLNMENTPWNFLGSSYDILFSCSCQLAIVLLHYVMDTKYSVITIVIVVVVISPPPPPHSRTAVLRLLPLAPQPSLGLGLLHKIRLSFLEASQQFSFLQGRVVSPSPNPIPEDESSVFISPRVRMATHFSRLLRHAWFTVGLFLFPSHHTGSCMRNMLCIILKGNFIGNRPSGNFSIRGVNILGRSEEKPNKNTEVFIWTLVTLWNCSVR